MNLALPASGQPISSFRLVSALPTIGKKSVPDPCLLCYPRMVKTHVCGTTGFEAPRVAGQRRWSHWLVLAVLMTGFGTLMAAAADKPFDPQAATDTWLNTLPAADRAKSDAYFEGGYILQVWNLALSLVIAWALLRFQVTVKLRDLAERLTRIKYVQGVVFVALFILVSTVLNLPSDFYEGFVREHRFGLSNLSVGGWFGEQVKGLLVGMIFSSLIGSLLYLALRKFQQRWWQMAAVVVPFLLFLVVVLAPVFVAPLFNTYKGLESAAIRDPILAMARANGVPADNVYEFDASKQTKRISANVSGAWGTIRVSLNDNLLQRCTPAEIQAVMGHELGHYVLNHVYKLVIYQSLLLAAALAFANWFYGAASRRWGARWGLRGIDDFAGLPLLTAGLSLFMFCATPISNSIIRTTEAEADIFGLNAARQPDGFASTALKLAEYRKLSPGPWEEIVFYDHPSGRSRILMAMKWKAEHLAEFPLSAPVGSPTGK